MDAKNFPLSSGNGHNNGVIGKFINSGVPINPAKIMTIEWHMLDKRKFFPLSMTSSFCIRCFLHPLSVIKTKIQVCIINCKSS